MGEERKALDRREFLRRAAMTGATAMWAAPMIQTIAATPGFAQSTGSPAPCFKSLPNAAGWSCMTACTTAVQATGCQAPGEVCDGVDPEPNNPLYGLQGPCQFFCPSGQGGDNPCCNPGLCDPRNFVCRQGGTSTEYAEYTGPTVGCPTP